MSPTPAFRPRLGAPRRAPGAQPEARTRAWAWAGAALGLLIALPMTVPAAWVAGLVSRATEGRLQLAEAEGPWWDGSALPVLTGTLRHDHLPIRFSAIVSFAALGPEGYGGMLQGLEDESSEVQEIVFAIVLSRDLYAFRRGQPPELLASALSSQRAEVRFAAARPGRT